MESSSVENLIFYLGSFGLLLALIWLVLRWGKKSRRPSSPLPSKATPVLPAAAEDKNSLPTSSVGSNSWWSALSKSRDRFVARLSGLNVEELKGLLEESCLTSDLGVSNTQEALDAIQWSELAKLPESERVPAAKQILAQTFLTWLAPSPLSAAERWPEKKNLSGPTVIWFVGVNGVGKTTSIAKVAAELKAHGHSVLLAAGDTFRAAAGEQLEEWAKRLQITCVKGAEGADSSSVLFDALQKGQAQKTDFILCDSAGRLHTQSQLMEALEKNKRVMHKALPGSPHEVVLVLDANTGQNMLQQAEQFLKSVGVSGLILTKLDGSARGGAVVAVSRKIGLPIYRLGLGEKAEDMRPFDPRAFAAALLGLDSLKEKLGVLGPLKDEKSPGV